VNELQSAQLRSHRPATSFARGLGAWRLKRHLRPEVETAPGLAVKTAPTKGAKPHLRGVHFSRWSLADEWESTKVDGQPDCKNIPDDSVPFVAVNELHRPATSFARGLRELIRQGFIRPMSSFPILGIGCSLRGVPFAVRRRFLLSRRGLCSR
jgi:hypothetical protein